jgi:hypothetical protein
MNRSQLEALLDKLAADDASLQSQAVRRAEVSHGLLVVAMLAIQALASALEKVLGVLAEQHGGIVGPWLDEVEFAVINDARAVIASGPTADEAALIGKGIKAVEEVFAEFRAKLQLPLGGAQDEGSMRVFKS